MSGQKVQSARRSSGLAVRDVLMVSREYDMLAGAGGVKDVCRQLAEALVRHADCRVRVVLPRYGFIDPTGLGFSKVVFGANRSSFAVDMHYPDRERREQVSVWHNRLQGVDVYLIEASRFAEKKGVYTYTADDETQEPWQRCGMGHYDYFAMNILLQKATLDLLILLNDQPDIIHCHDGHAATLPALMRELPGYRHFFVDTGALVTIHNAGRGYHQEIADLTFCQAVTGLPSSVIGDSLLGNCFDPFVSAAGRAVMNTVSENYARELQQTSEDARTGWLGHELLKRGVKIFGITNGINPEDYNPEEPDILGLAAGFSPAKGDLAGKAVCKNDLLALCSRDGHWPGVTRHGYLAKTPELPLLSFIGRLTPQKGVDLLLQAIPLLLAEKKEETFQLVLLGSGEPELEQQLEILATRASFAGRICFLNGYDPGLANRVYAGGDFFLIPSLYEPCGLTDYMAQLMGNLPVVHHVGGLVKVVDGETGFAYTQHGAKPLAQTMQRAVSLYFNHPERLLAMQKEAVLRIHKTSSWKQVIRKYCKLYTTACRV